jgi:DNA-binding NarL/FixJ family response regulator
MTLSPRQLQVLRLIADGQRDKDISSRLNIAIGVVRKHATRAMHKLSASNRCNMVWIGRHFIEQRSPAGKGGA